MKKRLQLFIIFVIGLSITNIQGVNFASLPTTTTSVPPTAPDTDMDGVTDDIDLDDDNDGIPDELERCILGSDINWREATTNSEPRGNYPFAGTTARLLTEDSDGIIKRFKVNSLLGSPDFPQTIQWQQDETDGGTVGAQSTTFKIDFDAPVYNVGIKLFDVDWSRNTSWKDSLQINFFSGGVAQNLTASDYNIDASYVIYEGNNNFKGTDMADNGSGDGYIFVKIDNLPIDSIRIIFRNGVGFNSHGIGFASLYTSPRCGAIDRDSDNDGIFDHLDIDSDNDGIPDIIEAGGTDINGDGRVDYPVPNTPSSMTDLDGDGLFDLYDDEDSAGGTLGWTNGTPIRRMDTDADGFYDDIDLDADNDGIPDIIEVGATDFDGDGKVSGTSDADGDGLINSLDPYNELNPGTSEGTPYYTTGADSGDGTPSTPCATCDNDGDGTPDQIDLDSDNDGITDLIENASGNIGVDKGSSGFLDGKVYNQTDSDLNGWNDSNNSLILDTDGDDVPDYLDVDSDNDGIPDYKENVCSTCPSFGIYTGTDTDGNGVLNDYENLNADNTNNTTGTNIGAVPNVDDNSGNTTPDYLDTDTDNDSAMDWTEAFDANDNGVTIDDFIAAAFAFESSQGKGFYTETDTDSDGIPDWMDNQPGTDGYSESNRPPFLDPNSDYWFDENEDGLATLLDFLENGSAAPLPDNNSADDLDWRDNTIASFLPVELLSFNVQETDCKMLLTWTTGSELNFSHFEIEWSKDGEQFEKVHMIDGKEGNSVNEYQFEHDEPSYYNYYRLKMIDQDGTFEYSNLKYVILNCVEKRDVSIYPNPVGKEQNMLTTKFYANSRHTMVTISDLNGKPVMRLNLPTEQGWNTVRINTTLLSSGIYFLYLGDNRDAKQFSVLE